MKPSESSHDEEVLAEINITPFTDVLLVLLIIFMILAALVVPPGFERTLDNPPKPAHHITIANSIPIVIDSNQRIRVDGTPTTVPGLYIAMHALAQHRQHPRIALYADARARYELVIRVLDAAKIEGIRDVSFVTQ